MNMILASAAYDYGLPLMLALATGALAYFAANYILAKSEFRKLSQVERNRAEIDEAERRKARKSPKQKLQLALYKRGYRGDLTPVMLLSAFGYLAVAVVLRFFGINGFLTYLAAAPVAIGIAIVAFNVVAQRRRRLFNRQLIQVFQLMASRLEGGVGPVASLEQVKTVMSDPMGRELGEAMAGVKTPQALVEALQKLYLRYPTQGFKLFVAAMEIDSQQGGKIEPALRQASATLQRDIDLAEETVADLAETRLEFFAIVAIIGLGVVTMFTSLDEAGKQVFFTGIGLIVVLLGVANFGLGIYRALRLLNRARGDS